jgi:uncharacterized protein YkwD
VPSSRTARRGLVPALTALCATAAVVAAFPVPAGAAVTESASCVDGGGTRWTVKATWGKTYKAADGKIKVTMDYAGWTTAKAGSVPTDARVRVYDGEGQKLADKSSSGAFDYQAGGRFASRNPLNPPTSPGKARVVLTLGVDGDGFGSCSVTLRQPTATAGESIPAPSTPAPVTPSPTPSTPATPQPATASDRYESDVLAGTNAERTAAGLTPLTAQACVDSFAETQARKMADESRMYHQDLTPILSTCGLRMVGENVAEGFPDGKAVMVGWMNSPGHKANILKPEYRLLGVGAVQNSQGRWYSAQVFGTLR